MSRSSPVTQGAIGGLAKAFGCAVPDRRMRPQRPQRQRVRPAARPTSTYDRALGDRQDDITPVSCESPCPAFRCLRGGAGAASGSSVVTLLTHLRMTRPAVAAVACVGVMAANSSRLIEGQRHCRPACRAASHDPQRDLPLVLLMTEIEC